MTRTRPITASIDIELTLNLTAVFIPGCEAWGGAQGEPPLNPPEPDLIEDVAIEALLYETMEVDRGDGSLPAKRHIITHDLLANVDTSNPHVQTLLSNLLACVNDAAEEALLAEVGE